MANSLQSQLIQAGLADEKQARKAKSGKRHQKKKKGQRNAPPGESALAAQKAQAQKAARDRELNERRKAKAERKALVAQIRQMVRENRLERGEDAQIGYHFQHGEAIRKIYVTDTMRRQLGDGRLEIVRMDGRYELVPAEVADRIRQRDPAFVMDRQAPAPEESAADDPYKDYEIPDDLMW